jgi:REP element-mobilizing transposase RayT
VSRFVTVRKKGGGGVFPGRGPAEKKGLLMSRKTELLLSSGACFHVYNRGVNREPIFFGTWGYEYFMRKLAKSLEGAKVSLMAYTLMPNHFHLILRQERPYEMARFMKALCEPYAKAVNAFLSRKGHLFESSYRPILVDDLQYLLHLSWYVHLNPVRARLVSDPLEWTYSSCREYCGMEKSGFLKTGDVLAAFGTNPEAEYRKYLKTRGDLEQEWVERYTFRR